MQPDSSSARRQTFWVVPALDGLGVSLPHHENDGGGIGRGIIRQFGAPVGRDLPRLLGDHVDVVLQAHGHDIGRKPIDHGAGLLARPAVRHVDLDCVALIWLEQGGERGAEILIYLTRRMV